MSSTQLKTALTQAGMTGEELAERLQVDPRTVRRWLDGRTPYPRYRASVSELLGQPVVELWPDLAATDDSDDETQSDAETVTVVRSGSGGLVDWRELARAAQRRVDLLDLTFADVLRDESDTELLAHAARRGCQVRVLLSDRDSAYLAIAEQELGQTTSITSRPSQLAELDHVVELLRPPAARREIEVRTFVAPGSYRVLSFDDHTLARLRIAGVDADEAPVLDVPRGSTSGGLYDTFSRHFETLWRTGEPVS